MDYHSTPPCHRRIVTYYHDTRELTLVISVALLVGLLLLVTALSFSYSTFKHFNTSSRRLQQITASHAFATEGVQLFVAAAGVASVFVYLLAEYRTNILACDGIGTPGSRFFTTSTGCFDVVLLHAFTIHGIDLVEGRILLGKWQHPYQGRCFILTRFALRKLTRRWRGWHGISTTESHASRKHSTTTSTGAQTSKYRSAERSPGYRAGNLERRLQALWGDLAYLDLAVDDSTWTGIWRRSWSVRRPSTPLIVDDAVAKKHNGDAAALPLTPPDSEQGRLTSEKSVNSSLAQREVSLGGKTQGMKVENGDDESQVGESGDNRVGREVVKNLVRRWEQGND